MYCPSLVEIYVKVNIRPLKIFKIPHMTLWQIFMVDNHLCTPPVSLLSQECWFPQLPQISVGYLCWSHSAVSSRCMQITISNQSGNHANQYLAYNYWKYCSFRRSRAFSELDVENYWSVTRYHLKSPVTRSWGHQSYPGPARIRVELTRRFGHPVFVRMVQGRIITADIPQDIQTDAPDWLLTIAACWHTSTGTGTISTGLLCYLRIST